LHNNAKSITKYKMDNFFLFFFTEKLTWSCSNSFKVVSFSAFKSSNRLRCFNSCFFNSCDIRIRSRSSNSRNFAAISGEFSMRIFNDSRNINVLVLVSDRSIFGKRFRSAA
ncbi:hypothetical protein T4E_9192, partial [Trichinella pseudospiralis]